MKEKSSSAVGIIGGADGPTSIFVAGRTGKLPLKIRIKNHIYKWKSKKAQKSIVAGAHTLEEVVAYADEKYHLTEVTESQRKYAEQRKCLKESLVSRYKPELLGDLKEVKRPEIYTEDSVKELQRQFFARREMIDSHMIEVDENGEDVTVTSHTGFGGRTYTVEGTDRTQKHEGESAEARLKTLSSPVSDYQGII